jgi:hypothetical protein
MTDDSLMTREREPLRATLTRTVGIALITGAAVAWRWGSLTQWPVLSVLMLWPSLGGALFADSTRSRAAHGRACSGSVPSWTSPFRSGRRASRRAP